MGPGAFSVRERVHCDVIVCADDRTRLCRALIDADCWPSGGVPVDMGGYLDLTRPEWEALASSDRLILRLQQNGEPYRMILDGMTGRFVAHQL